MRSMTGYGQAAGDNGRHAVSVTLRGVNHRFLELKLRLDEEHRASEPELRELLTAELHRGRVDVGVDVRVLGERAAEVEIHRGVVQAAHVALHELVEEGLIARELTAGDLLRLPEALTVRLSADRWDDGDRALLLAVAGRALEQLVAAREIEGASLARALAERIERLEAVVERLGELCAVAQGEILEALRQRLDRLLDGRALDETRLAQEAALLADKGDIREELDRLTAHIGHFREVAAATGAIGKRLDFLMQEILRELNTLGAKCKNVQMTRLVLDAKELAEQLREQVQNVE